MSGCGEEEERTRNRGGKSHTSSETKRNLRDEETNREGEEKGRST